MHTYHTNELTLTLPDHLRDRSVTAFVVPARGGGGPQEPGEFSFVISRDEAPEGGTARAFTENLLEGLAESLPGYALVSRLSTVLDRLPAEEAEFTWTSSGKAMHQHMTMVLTNGTMLTITGTALQDLFPMYRSTLYQMLRSIQLRR